MSDFRIHDENSTPEGSGPLLEGSRKSFGMIPNLVRERGRVTPEQLAAFRAAGYGQRQVLDILVAVSRKTLSNDLNHIAEAPVDAPFEKCAWQPGDAAA